MKWIFKTLLVLAFLSLQLIPVGVQQEVRASNEVLDKAKQIRPPSKEMGRNALKYFKVGKEHKLEINDKDNKWNIINRVIIILSRIVGTFGVLAFVTGGYFMIIANGDEQKISKGKSMMMISSIGLIVTFLSYIIVTFVLSVVYGL